MLTRKDYETIDVNEMYEVKVRTCTGEIETVVEDGSELM